jgi:hypothetical protein
MNPLDLLFDFAALMSTSSAITLPPKTNETPPGHHTSTQDPSSKAPSSANDTLTACYQGQVHWSAPLPQQDRGATSVLDQEHTIAFFPRDHACESDSHPLNHLPVTSYAKHAWKQQYPRHAELQCSQDTDLGCVYACGHRSSQGCQRAALPPALDHQTMASHTINNQASGYTLPWTIESHQFQHMEPGIPRLQHFTGIPSGHLVAQYSLADGYGWHRDDEFIAPCGRGLNNDFGPMWDQPRNLSASDECFLEYTGFRDDGKDAGALRYCATSSSGPQRDTAF